MEDHIPVGSRNLIGSHFVRSKRFHGFPRHTRLDLWSKTPIGLARRRYMFVWNGRALMNLIWTGSTCHYDFSRAGEHVLRGRREGFFGAVSIPIFYLPRPGHSPSLNIRARPAGPTSSRRARELERGPDSAWAWSINRFGHVVRARRFQLKPESRD